MHQAVQKLSGYLDSLGNHKLEKLEGPNIFSIVRKNKQYAFNLDFEKVQSFGFKLSHMQSFKGKDEIVIFYIG